MANGSGTKQPTDDRSILLDMLKEHQSNYKEGSYKWLELQKKIDNLVAQNYLEMLNA